MSRSEVTRIGDRLSLAANADRVHHRYYGAPGERRAVLNSRCQNGENLPRLRCNFAAANPFNETSV